MAKRQDKPNPNPNPNPTSVPEERNRPTPMPEGHNRPTPASEWKRVSRGSAVILLPSGRRVRMHPVRLDVMLRRGEVPQMLAPLAAKMLWAGDVPTDQSVNPDEVKQYLDLIDLVCVAAVEEPKMVFEDDVAAGDDDVLIVERDVELGDKFWIFQIALQPAEALFRLSQKQRATVDAVHDGTGVRPATE